VRQALFNILGADIQNAILLDLFAGTGSVGVEALSRGAAFVTFIDLHRQAINTVRENLTITGLGEKAQVLQMDAFAYLERQPDYQYDYVYIAPPQYKKLWIKALLLLDNKHNWLTPDAWIIVQIHPVEYEPLHDLRELQNLIEFDQRRYGSTLLIFFRQGMREEQ
jgi:16S rRNA (guanine(966)-N(2))-methyltransferase RsmD